jgi:hypothetical protein
MKQTKKKTIETETVVDVLCDLCGESTKTMVDCDPFSYGTLSFVGGYGSEHDTEQIHMELCEACVYTIVRLRKNGVNISIKHPSTECFEAAFENALSKHLNQKRQ